MADSDKDQVIKNLRACLLSTKGGISASNLDRDYKMIVGKRIPYQKLGYSSLESFLKTIPDVSVYHGSSGELILDAIPTKSSEHVAALVAKQKSAPRKPIRSIAPRRTAASSWRPPPSGMSMKPRPRSPRLPLSVTVSNRVDSRGVNFEKPSRMVSFTSSATSTTQSSGSSGGSGRTYHSSFEKPPRFLRMEQQENVTSSSSTTTPVPTPTAAPVQPAPAPVQAASVPTPVSITAPVAAQVSAPVSHSFAQDRLQNIIAASAKKEAEVSKQVQARSITSPLTPLHARLSAAVRKPQTPLLAPLEEKLATTSLGGGDDFIKQLEDLAASRGMVKPTFKVIPRTCDGITLYSCSVKIGEFRINSFPDERSSPEDAIQLTARQAVEELRKMSSMTGGSATQDENIIMMRISQIVDQHRYGLWSSQIPIDYSNKYNETLPEDWLKVMKKCPVVTLEHAAGNRIILTPKWPSESSMYLYQENSFFQGQNMNPGHQQYQPLYHLNY